MQAPLVSIVIPAYNAEQFLEAAIESAVSQSYAALEVIVVSDGSTDRTVEIAKSFGDPVVCFEKNNGGVSSARNFGIARAKGKWVAFLDADDIWRPEKIEKQVKALVEDESLRVAHTAFAVVDEHLSETDITSCTAAPVETQDLFLLGNVVGTPSSVIAERSLFDEVGGFDERLSYCADWEMWMRLSKVATFAYVDEPLVLYRQHEENMSNNASLLESDSLKMFEIAFSSGRFSAEQTSLKNRALGKNYMVLAGTYFHASMFADFIRCSLRAVFTDPGQIRYLIEFPLRTLRRP